MSSPLPPLPPKPPGPPRGGQPLDYATPSPDPARNSWQKVRLRIFAGIGIAIVSGLLGSVAVMVTHVRFFQLLVPLAVLGGLIFVAIKYRRFGYVTGFVLAPFVVVATLFVVMLIVCGIGGVK